MLEFCRPADPTLRAISVLRETFEVLDVAMARSAQHAELLASRCSVTRSVFLKAGVI
jgi:hypothetical protein